MRVRKPAPQLIATTTSEVPLQELEQTPSGSQINIEELNVEAKVETTIDDKVEHVQVHSVDSIEFLDYSNGRILTALSYAIWCIVLVANVYAIVMLILKIKT